MEGGEEKNNTNAPPLSMHTYIKNEQTKSPPQKKSTKNEAKAVPEELRNKKNFVTPLSSYLFFQTVLTKSSRSKRKPDLPADCKIVWLDSWWFPFHPELVPFFLLITAPQLRDSCCSSLLLSYLETEKCALPVAFCTSAFACLLAVVRPVVFVTFYSFFVFLHLSQRYYEKQRAQHVSDILNCLCSSTFKDRIVKPTMALLASLLLSGIQSHLNFLHSWASYYLLSKVHHIQNSSFSHYGRY